jgi:hypothetical protein
MSETEPAEKPPNRHAPLDIWREVRRVLSTLFDLFGEPNHIAARHTLTLKDHQMQSKWLRAVEALMRRMLFIEAALIACADTPLPARERKIAKQSGEGRGPRAAPDPLPTSPLQGEESVGRWRSAPLPETACAASTLRPSPAILTAADDLSALTCGARRSAEARRTNRTACRAHAALRAKSPAARGG